MCISAVYRHHGFFAISLTFYQVLLRAIKFYRKIFHLGTNISFICLLISLPRSLQNYASHFISHAIKSSLFDFFSLSFISAQLSSPLLFLKVKNMPQITMQKHHFCIHQKQLLSVCATI